MELYSGFGRKHTYDYSVSVPQETDIHPVLFLMRDFEHVSGFDLNFVLIVIGNRLDWPTKKVLNCLGK